MTAPTDPSKKIIISSRFEELDRIVDEAEAFYKACLSDEEKVFTGVLLASEAVTNAIEHGNASDPAKKVIIDFRLNGTQAELWVEDEGDGFNRDEIANPLASENLLEDGGRGIFLIERLADGVKYEKEGRRIGIFFNL
ncbi:MAG: ATP-binding protein [Bacteroidetes bacterium]|nr:ATP-binding protein [Bacteroidota bacterium]MDA1333996.1 ATP-binding protein [Bacteroidota bacterium]